MPFSLTPTRSAHDLAEFFNTNLRARIESEPTLAYQYVVRRSDDTFNITEQIVRDLYDADIVVCDLSGHTANPNVMYELGVRLSITNKPVILCREASTENRTIFDIHGFHTFEYSPTRYRELEQYLIAKIKKFETGEELYESPVQRIVGQLPSVVDRLKRDRALAALDLIVTNIESTVIAFELSADDLLLSSAVEFPLEDSTTEHLVKDPERFAALDWGALGIRPRAMPALQAFLSDPILHGIMAPAHLSTIIDNVADYYSHYFADDSKWDRLTFAQFRNFMASSEAIHAAFRFLARYLRGDDSEASLQWALELFQSPLESLARLYESDKRVVLDDRL